MLTLPLTLMLAAAVCFAIALVVALGISGNFDAWLAGGLLAAVLSMIVAPFAPPRPQ